VRRWLTEVPVDHTARLESLLRSLFYWLMDPEELGEHLASEAAFYRAAAAGFREYAAAKDRGEYGDAPSVKSMRMTIEAGIRLYEALADWAEWAQEAPRPGAGADDR